MNWAAAAVKGSSESFVAAGRAISAALCASVEAITNAKKHGLSAKGKGYEGTVKTNLAIAH